MPRRAAAIPATWYPTPSINGAGLGSVSIEIPPQFKLPTSGAEIWIGPDGADHGRGTFSRPFLTLQHALERPESIVNCLPGRYAPAVLRGRSKSILAPYGRVVIATPGPALSDFAFLQTARPGIFAAELPRTVAPRAVLFRSRFDDFGREKRMPIGAEGWTYDAERSELSIRMDDVADRHGLRALYVNPYNRSSVLLDEGGDLAIGPGVLLEGVAILARPDKGKPPRVLLHGCGIDFAPANGLTVMGGVAFSFGARIHAAESDCFNYGGDYDGHPNLAIEYNCHASEAGDATTYGLFNPKAGRPRDTMNGSSSHSSRIARYGGIYERSLGADVVDTWTADEPEETSSNFGVLTRSSRIGIGFYFVGGTGEPTALLERCASTGQRVDLLAEKRALVLKRRCDLPHTWLVDGGMIQGD